MPSNDLLITDRNQIRKAWEKTENDVNKDIQIIKEWLQTQKHLPEIPTDNMIEFFLVNCKFSIEKTKQTLDMYYTVPNLVPDLYKNINPCTSDVDIAYKTANFVCIPVLTPSLHRLTVCQYKDSEDGSVSKLSAHCLRNVYEIRIHEDLSMGEIYLVDCERVKFSVIAKITPLLLKQIAFVLEVYSHKSLDELLEHLPLDVLPSDFGGKQKSCEELAELWKKKMFEYKDRFDKLETLQVTEELRPEKLENDELLGYYGNFKKIDTD
uniref:Uncharacterized protein LOC114335002 isoform X2 n=1 Tax=Diabrotica virgifera virgifera TaxID=50390 RepID=A0A6P7FWP6_DIAVI